MRRWLDLQQTLKGSQYCYFQIKVCEISCGFRRASVWALGLDTYVQSTCLTSGPAGWTPAAGCSTAAPSTEGETHHWGLAFMLMAPPQHKKWFLTTTRVHQSAEHSANGSVNRREPNIRVRIYRQLCVWTCFSADWGPFFKDSSTWGPKTGPHVRKWYSWKYQ